MVINQKAPLEHFLKAKLTEHNFGMAFNPAYTYYQLSLTTSR